MPLSGSSQVAQLTILSEMGIDDSSLTNDNKSLVMVIIGGIEKLLDHKFEAERAEFQAKISR